MLILFQRGCSFLFVCFFFLVSCSIKSIVPQSLGGEKETGCYYVHGCGWPLAMSSPKTARLHFSVGETKAAFGNEEDEEGGKAHGNV